MLGYYVMRHFDREDDPSFFTNLTREGHRRARAFFLPGIQRVVVSPFKRCVQSAQPFAVENDIPMKVACALGEYIDDDRHGLGFETVGELRRRVEAFIIADAPRRLDCTLYITHASIAEMLCPGETFTCGDVRYVPVPIPTLWSSDMSDTSDTSDSDADVSWVEDDVYNLASLR